MLLFGLGGGQDSCIVGLQGQMKPGLRIMFVGDARPDRLLARFVFIKVFV